MRVVEGGQANVKGLAIDFLVYGAMAEILGERRDLTGGMGGVDACRFFFRRWGFIPIMQFVGGSADIAVGAAAV